MLDTLKGPKREVVSPGSREQYIDAFNWMLLARTAEEKLASLWRAGKISGGVYLGKGQEAISAALGIMLKSGDIFGPLIRDQAGRLAFGESLIDVFRVHFGSRTGLSRGRDGNVHRGNPRRGYHAMISHLGSLISVVAGALLARRFKGDTSAIGATTIGDGGTSTGAFHEAINMAAVEKLPLGCRCRKQSVRLFDAQQPAIRLSRSGGPRHRLWSRRPLTGWHRSLATASKCSATQQSEHELDMVPKWSSEAAFG